VADPTVAEVLSDAAGHLGDTAAEQFTPTVLAPFFGQAYREAFGVMIALKLPMGKRTVSPVVLTANTTSLDPSTSSPSLADLDEPNTLWERTAGTTQWYEMTPVGELPQYSTTELNRYWKWENSTFYFIGATGDTELKVQYSANGTAPTSGAVGIQNSRSFLALRTASIAAFTYDMPTRGGELKLEALGPTGQPDASGGALRALFNPMLLEKQKRRCVPGPFRPRRNVMRNFW
jgi:hypothetical protein